MTTKKRTTKKTPRTAAIYARTAVANPTKIDEQIAASRAFARAQGLTVGDVFTDDGVSGLTFDRPGFADLCVGVHRGRVRTVIVSDASRLGREPIEVAHLIKRLQTIGVRVLSVADDGAAHVALPSAAFLAMVNQLVDNADKDR
jgi:DNA invertase Pin-like site-specific DNA recombinase